MMLHNISRRCWTAMSVFFVGLMMLLSPLNVAPALASERVTHIDYDITSYVTGPGSYDERLAHFTAKLDLDDDDRVTGTAKLDVGDGVDIVNMSLSAYELYSDGGIHYLKWSGTIDYLVWSTATINQRTVIAELTISPDGTVVVIAVLFL